jgi:hypothetical protein
MVFYITMILDDTSYEQVIKYCHGQWMMQELANTLISLVNNLTM